ncbi:hypothetical protein HOH45_06415, partial [bacterium]|nr:hypothetical protein [bacterium]
MGSLIFKILSLKTITDNQVLEDKLSSLTSSMEGLVLFLSSVTELQSFDELKCRVDNQIDDTVLHVQTSEPQSKKVSDFLSLKERVASGVNSENKEELCSLFVAILSLYSENVIPAEVNQSMVLMIEKIQNSDSHYFKDTSYVQLFKTFSLMLLSAYFSKSNCVLPALSIYPLGANLQCRDGGNVEIELATTKLSNHPAQQYIEGFIEMFIAKESLLQSVPWQMHKHVPMGIRILLGGDKKAISKIDRYALGAMTYVSAGSMVDVFKSFRHVFRDSIEDVSSLLRKKTFTVDDRKQIEESLIFCDADSESLTGCFFSPLTDEDSMPIFGESDVSNVGPFFRDSGLAYIQDLYVANSEDFEVVDRLLVSSLETWSYVTCDENGRLTISSHNMWGKLSGDAPCEHLTEGQTNRLFNVILPNFYQYERSENYLSNVEQSIQSSVYSKNKETIPRRFSLDDYHDFFDPTKTDLLIDQVSQCLVDFSIGLDVNLECVSDALFLLNVVSETCRDSSYIIASDIFQHVTVDVLLNIEERVSGNPYLLNRLSQVKDRYAVVTQHAGLQIYRQYLNGTIDLSKQEEINTLGTAYIRFNAPYSRMDRYLEKVVDHLMCSRTCIIDKVLSADFSDNENLFFFMNPMTVKTLLLRKTNQEKAKFLFFK